MKKSFIFLFLTLATRLVIAQNIYNGGYGDGWSKDNLQQPAYNIYNGGNADGWASNNIQQPAVNIYNGGYGDGWSNTNLQQAATNIFNGGNGDGWASIKAYTGNDVYACSAGSTQFMASGIGTTYQWQSDTGGGFQDISNNSNYSGTATALLTLVNVPSSFYGYKYRCLVNGTAGNVYTLKIAAYWMGGINTAWEVAGNWGCGTIPDANTDVFIFAGKPNYPVVNNNTSCRSISANEGTSVKVITGKLIVLTGAE